jgi:REP element-mobilizing transposase RayT
LADAPVFLTESQRDTVDRALVCACAEQPWTLHERNVRTNHVHVVVSADRDGRFVRAHLKAIASAALSDAAGLPMADKNGRRRWWTEKGNVEAVESERALTEICLYVRERQ